MRGPQTMKMIEERLAKKEEDLRVLLAEIAQLKSIIAELRGLPTEQTKKSRSPRSSVKNEVLTLLAQVKHDGLNAALAVEMAQAKGVELDRGSVSSLLSRLKEQGTLDYDGRVYRLTEFVAPLLSKASAQESATVFHHPSSRIAS